MSKPLSLSNIIRQCRERWQALPDQRKPNNNMRYAIADAALAALSVFLCNPPLFWPISASMELRKRKNNGRTLFGIAKIPSDNQLRNLLDPITPDHFQADFDWIVDDLAGRHRRYLSFVRRDLAGDLGWRNVPFIDQCALSQLPATAGQPRNNRLLPQCHYGCARQTGHRTSFRCHRSSSSRRMGMRSRIVNVPPSNGGWPHSIPAIRRIR